MRDKILKLLINIGAVLAIAFAFYKLIKPYMPRGMLDSSDNHIQPYYSSLNYVSYEDIGKQQT